MYTTISYSHDHMLHKQIYITCAILYQQIYLPCTIADSLDGFCQGSFVRGALSGWFCLGRGFVLESIIIKNNNR